VAEDDEHIPEKIGTSFMWGNGWERGRGGTRPGEDHRITESLRLEKASKIIKSSCKMLLPKGASGRQVQKMRKSRGKGPVLWLASVSSGGQL